MEPVVIRARDGLELNGYLTQPSDLADAGKPPLVLVIHGGPYWRDYWGFNPDHQWLANRGYVVLSVNYRGSTGFGKALSRRPIMNGAVACMTISSTRSIGRSARALPTQTVSAF